MPEDAAPPSPPPGVSVELAALYASAYDDLRRLARARLRMVGPMTLLDTAGLVGDTFKRLAMQPNVRVASRAQFLGYCARVMRSVIIDLVREKNAARHGGGIQKITLNTALMDALPAVDGPLQIDAALSELAAVEPRLAQVVEMRYFGGYSEEEMATALGVTTRTIERDWQKARLLLQRMLSDED